MEGQCYICGEKSVEPSAAFLQLLAGADKNPNLT